MKSIMEIDGVPMAYMELYGEASSCVRFDFKTIAYKFSSPEAAKEGLNLIMAEIRELLPDGGIIIWRHRPDVDGFARTGRTGGIYMRLETSPPLPSTFWEKHQRLEGQPTRKWGDPPCKPA
jgi:hypothetical protein